MTSKEYSMMDVAPTVSAILQIPSPGHAKGVVIPEIFSTLKSDKIALLVLDAFGLFAWNLWKSEMPYLSSLHAVNSAVVRSVMPSITPVNFATMVTGTDQAGHGIHTFKDDFACETLFDTVRKANRTSAGVGLNGYTGSELLARFADIHGNVGNASDDGVADRVIEIADRAKPAFLIAQFGKVDTTFHQYGPSSPLVIPMLKATDARLKKVIEHLKPMGYGIVVLADHGQHDVINPLPGEHKGLHGTDQPEDRLVPCTWI